MHCLSKNNNIINMAGTKNGNRYSILIKNIIDMIWSKNYALKFFLHDMVFFTWPTFIYFLKTKLENIIKKIKKHIPLFCYNRVKSNNKKYKRFLKYPSWNFLLNNFNPLKIVTLN